jgi:hypothetical protein
MQYAPRFDASRSCRSSSIKNSGLMLLILAIQSPGGRSIYLQQYLQRTNTRNVAGSTSVIPLALATNWRHDLFRWMVLACLVVLVEIK